MADRWQPASISLRRQECGTLQSGVSAQAHGMELQPVSECEEIREYEQLQSSGDCAQFLQVRCMPRSVWW